MHALFSLDGLDCIHCLSLKCVYRSVEVDIIAIFLFGRKQWYIPVWFFGYSIWFLNSIVKIAKLSKEERFKCRFYSILSCLFSF